MKNLQRQNKCEVYLRDSKENKYLLYKKHNSSTTRVIYNFQINPYLKSCEISITVRMNELGNESKRCLRRLDICFN